MPQRVEAVWIAGVLVQVCANPWRWAAMAPFAEVRLGQPQGGGLLVQERVSRCRVWQAPSEHWLLQWWVDGAMVRAKAQELPAEMLCQ